MHRWIARAGCVLFVGAVGCGDEDVGAARAPEVTGPAPGYTRVVTRPIPDIQPGSDVLYVQWLTEPAETDIDVLDVTGWQSEGGHHVILFAVQDPQPVGTTRPWREQDMNGVLRYVGGLGEGANKAKLPAGTTFRVPKGWSVVANLHYVNPTSAPIDGEAFVDFRFATPSPARSPVGIFLNMSTAFTVPAHGSAETEALCEVKEEIAMIRIANHMHSHGAAADTEVIHADGTREDLIRDPHWTPEEYLDPKLTVWPPEAPYVLRPGDVVHTWCTWQNDDSDELRFPVEMCGGVAYFVSDDGRVQLCMNGAWL